MDDILIINLRHLLIHSLNETRFYDQAIDLVKVPSLKSSFAKYLWMRGEHIMGIRSYLLRSSCRLNELNFPQCPDPAAWEAFKKTIIKHDSQALMRWGMQKGKQTLRKYDLALSNVSNDIKLQTMLHHHMMDIKHSLDSLSSLKITSH